MIWSVLWYKRRSVITQKRVGSDFISAITSIRLQPKRKRQKRGKWRDDGQRHCVISRALNWWVLWVSSAATLFCFLDFSSTVISWILLVSVRTGGLAGVDCWGGTQGELQQHSQTRTGEAPDDETVVIRLRRHTRCEEMSERSAGSGRHYHLSATAAAMGTRILPRAVAASSSISVFNRLMTHSMASRPLLALTEMVFAISPSR